MGRKGKWPNRDTLLDLFKKEGSADRVAKLLRMHPHTVRKYLKLYGAPMKTGPQTGRRRWSAFANWLRENPEDVLPPSVREISELTGISKDSIKSYLYRRRREARSLIQSQPWLNGGSVLWTDSTGVMIPDSAFSTVRCFTGITGTLKFVVRLQDGTPHLFFISLNDFKKMYA